MNIGSFGICSKTQKPCKPAVQKWLNGNGKKKIFDINTMNMEATVLEQGSYGVCSSNSGIVTFANSGQLPVKKQGWKTFKDRTVFKTIRRSGQRNKDERYPDIACNDVNKFTLLGGHNKKEDKNKNVDPDYFKSHPYFKYQEKEDEDPEESMAIVKRKGIYPFDNRVKLIELIYTTWTVKGNKKFWNIFNEVLKQQYFMDTKPQISNPSNATFSFKNLKDEIPRGAKPKSASDLMKINN